MKRHSITASSLGICFKELCGLEERQHALVLKLDSSIRDYSSLLNTQFAAHRVLDRVQTNDPPHQVCFHACNVLRPQVEKNINGFMHILGKSKDFVVSCFALSFIEAVFDS